ncbi:MAG: protein-ADP-ribose hydrolase [Methanobrevibacter sp.]|uniref:protein-ADP-ribose hydrolase n=1 Tax=Methanobrevibacter sp. TaxID=66852 RepID=UPI0025DDBEB7|nr:protein-ADP-ribose hydrolase [Methanobrevibacter sp.]MBR0271496.1 protein-ADP-ribose hydrolase [Methanobrevibacter sp.]
MDTNQQLDYLLNYLINERHDNIELPNDNFQKRNLLRSLMNVRPPNPISEEFLEVQDEFLTNETLSKDLVGVEDITEFDGKLMLWQGDITQLKVDAIVNAANSKLLGCFIPMHNCIDNVIHSASGIQLRLECEKIMKAQNRDEDIGKAKITDAYNLPSKHVIHTVGPAIASNSKPDDLDCKRLASCYKSCLEIASYHNLKSIAFCCISTGVFNFPKEKAAEIAIGTVNEYLNFNESSLEHVIFNVFGDDDYLIYKNLLFGD